MTIIRGRWFPAIVTPPAECPWRRCYVIAADDGLHVWRSRAEVAQWQSPINWELTHLPDKTRPGRGVDVHTDAGLVVVTPGSGCRCGAMGSWRGPEWSQVEQVRV
ncbi:MAG: hypothetical protein ACRDTT_03590 [Pseudonocardiaceae bacterium]